MTVKLLTEHNLEFLGLTGGCTGLSEFTLVKIPHCWKSHVTAQLLLLLFKENYNRVLQNNGKVWLSRIIYRLQSAAAVESPATVDDLGST